MTSAPETSAGPAPHPYFQAILDAFSAAGRPYFHQVTPLQAREILRAGVAAAPPPVGLPELASVTDQRIAGPAGEIPLRRYRPMGLTGGTCVFMHGGGWVIGDLDLSDTLCRRLAAGSGAEVVSVDYRLAPEHPFPAPLDDVYAVVEWVAARGAGPIVVAGESAGGNLAAACAIRARDMGGPRLAGQFLAYPVTDYDCETRSHREMGPRNWLLSTADMRWFWNHYCPPGVDRADPLVSPLRLSDPSGLPSTLLYVAELDPLRDEGLDYADRLAAAGVEVAAREDAGVLHGYLSSAGAVPAAAQAVAEAGEWIKARIRDGAA